MLPVPAGAIDQVTAVLTAFVTVAANCWRCDAVSVLVCGLTATTDTGGSRITVAAPVMAVLAWSVAVTVTVCCVAMLAGAVYRPVALTLPAPEGLIDQFTGELQLPMMVDVNCCVCDA